jgi:hypothetical protein
LQRVWVDYALSVPSDFVRVAMASSGPIEMV